MPENTLLDTAVRQIAFARDYTTQLLADIEPDDWFRQPEGVVSHLAWQIGHLTMAEYMLVLFRLRGKQPDDERLVPKPFLRCFVKGSTPVSDPAAYPPPEEIRAALDGVHAMVLAEVPAATEEQLAQTVNEPYAMFPNLLGSLYFCASHEMLHAGQIGLLRRLLGKPPVR